ncbi:potassium/proton antiporter, CPA1 family [Litchfieldia salsa]|uniref:Potassium/proton antiporter, CPA1 family n=1 Tax=Litchfieldia salsa TaxID=930152 RepID=A0A1H0V7I8_9BACI|nr:potassium/proton antiporter, CPA1 family [Litchfieldia salsa]
MFNIDSFILLVALLLIIGVISTKFSTRVGVPALVLFIAVGMLFGSDGLGLIHFDNPKLAQLIGVIALIVILFEGGLQTKWTAVKPVLVPSLSLATIGVLITTSLVAVAAYLVFDISWFEAFLFGSIVGSTDAAAVFAVLKGQNIDNRLESTLEVESGTNDPMAVFLTITFIQLLSVEDNNILGLILAFFWQMGIGLAVGIIFGKLAVFAINKINLDSSGLYPVFAMAFALLTYSATALIHASGLLAVYIAALVIGSSDITYRHSIFRFNEGFAWMMQILMFVILGLLVFPAQLFAMDIMIKGLIIAGSLIVVARPVAVFISTIKLGFNTREKLFLSWAGLRGAVPIVLATYPMIAGLEDNQLFFNVVFFVVLTSSLIQGSTIPYMAKWLKLSGIQKTTPAHTLELVSIGKANAEIIEYEVNGDDFITNKKIVHLKLPKRVLINAIIRGENLITPRGDTTIRNGDILYILTSRESKEKLLQMVKTKTEKPDTPVKENTLK